MPGLSVALILTFLTIVFPLRSRRQKVRFGSAGRANYGRLRPFRWWAADALFLSGFGLELTARAEEPLLELVYGTPCRKYAATTGKFIPGVGLKRQDGP